MQVQGGVGYLRKNAHMRSCPSVRRSDHCDNDRPQPAAAQSLHCHADSDVRAGGHCASCGSARLCVEQRRTSSLRCVTCVAAVKTPLTWVAVVCVASNQPPLIFIYGHLFALSIPIRMRPQTVDLPRLSSMGRSELKQFLTRRQTYKLSKIEL